MLIDCPFCGSRDLAEFHCGGESHIQRPVPAETVSDEAWGAYLFDRANPRGRHFERWLHHGGCGLWFNLVRDTATHRILAIYAMDAPKPELEA